MIQIITNPDSLQRSVTGSITGQICLRGPTGFFPEESWHDFPVVILNWWVTGLGELASGKKGSFSGSFMDGPFSFRVGAGPRDVGRIAWGRRGSESNIGIVSIAALLQSAIAAGRLIEESCRAKNWASDDLDNLGQAISRNAA
jgi:hypothetical protein